MRHPLILDTKTILAQLQQILDSVSSDEYRHQPAYQTSSIGAHVRHILDHYSTLLSRSSDHINYEKRDRDPDLQADPALASALIEAHVSNLDDLEITQPLWLDEDNHHGAFQLPTTMGRELSFVLSHTIHHLATIKSIMAELDLEVPADVGIAFATLKYEQRA